MRGRSALVLTASVLVLALCAGSPSAFGDLAMFRGDLAHSGVYPGASVVGSPHLLWKFQTKGRIIGSPAISDGAAYVGSTDGNLYAVDAKTGAPIWKFSTHARIASSAAVVAGTVYFGSYDRNFYAVDAKTGALKWKFQNDERRFAAAHIHGTEPFGETMPDPFDFYLSSPGNLERRSLFRQR